MIYKFGWRACAISAVVLFTISCTLMAFRCGRWGFDFGLLSVWLSDLELGWWFLFDVLAGITMLGAYIFIYILKEKR